MDKIALAKTVRTHAENSVEDVLADFLADNHLNGNDDLKQPETVQKVVDDLVDSALSDLAEEKVTDEDGVIQYFVENVDFDFITNRIEQKWDWDTSKEKAIDVIGDELMANPEYSEAHELDWWTDKLNRLDDKKVLYGLSDLDSFVATYIGEYADPD